MAERDERRSRRDGPMWIERLTSESFACARARVVHDHVSLAFLTEGRAVMEQRERFEVGAGDVVLVPSGAAHHAAWSRSAKAWGLGFSAPFFAASDLAPLLDPFERVRGGASAVVAIPTERQEHLASLCAELRRETAGARALHGDLASRSLLALILAEVTRAAVRVEPAPRAPGIVTEALQFIERRCLDPISLEDVARAVGRSPSYVTTALTRATGKSALAWIIAARMAEARRRLISSDERVEIIAERVGYADVTHFIRLFRREHGETPAAWRAERLRERAGERALEGDVVVQHRGRL